MSDVKIGLQLYSIRDKMEADMEAALRAVKEIGYDYVELAGYFGHPAEEIRGWLKKYGLTCISVHQMPEFYHTDEGIAYVKALGPRYSVIPWYSKDHYITDMEGTLSYFTEMGQKLLDNGLEMLYHNHDFELATVGDKTILDRIYTTVPANLLNPEFDTCWIKYAGYDPCDYLRAYAGRYKLVHLKDFVAKQLGGGPVYALIDKDGKELPAASRDERGFAFRPIGSGIQDIPAIMKAALEGGAEYFIVEQDQCYEQDSLEAAKESREYLRSLGY